jgi:hypothetical protein
MKLIPPFLFLIFASGLPTAALAVGCNTAISGVVKNIDTASGTSDDLYFSVSIGTSADIPVWLNLGGDAGRALFELFQSALSTHATVQITKCYFDGIVGIKVASPYNAQKDLKKGNR